MNEYKHTCIRSCMYTYTYISEQVRRQGFLSYNIKGHRGYELLATSFFQPRHLRTDGQSTPRPSQPSTESVRPAYSTQIFCPRGDFNLQAPSWQPSRQTTRPSCSLQASEFSMNSYWLIVRSSHLRRNLYSCVVNTGTFHCIHA